MERPNEEFCWPEVLHGVAGRIARARERSGLSLGALAHALGGEYTADGCFDLETDDTEFCDGLSIQQIINLFDALDIQPAELFFGKGHIANPNEQHVSLDKIPELLQRQRQEQGISLFQQEERLNYKLDENFSERQLLEEWNLDVLRLACKELQIEWSALFNPRSV